MAEGEIFYEPGITPHGLPRDPYKSCVVPRPIGWISSRSPSGTDNLAPYSQFNNLTFDPPYVMFSANQDLAGARKDSVNNVEATQEFCWNVATWELREAVNASAEWVSPDIDEFERCGLEKERAVRRVLTEGKIDLGKVQPIARCGYHEYVVVKGESIFEMVIPGDPKQLVGLEGNAEKAKGLVDGEHAAESGKIVGDPMA